MKSGIYIITNLINNKVYIGQSKNIKDRFNSHKSDARRGKDYPISRAIRKYGISNFNFEILEYAPLNKLDELEIKMIKKYDSTNYNKGYNICRGGSNSINTKSVIYQNFQAITNDIKSTKMVFKDIAKKYSISISTVSQINLGQRWHNDSLCYPIRDKNANKVMKYYCKDCGSLLSRHAKNLCRSCYDKARCNNLTKDLLIEAIDNGLYIQQIANKYNVSHTTVRRWFKKYNFKIQ